MYENAAQVWEGFGKNLRAGCEGSIIAFILLIVLQGFLLLGPFVCVLFVPWLISGVAGALVWFQVVVVLGLRLIAAVTGRQSLTGVVLHPAGQFYFLLIAIASWRRYAAGSVTWKGRSYTPQSR